MLVAHLVELSFPDKVSDLFDVGGMKREVLSGSPLLRNQWHLYFSAECNHTNHSDITRGRGVQRRRVQYTKKRFCYGVLYFIACRLSRLVSYCMHIQSVQGICTFYLSLSLLLRMLSIHSTPRCQYSHLHAIALLLCTGRHQHFMCKSTSLQHEHYTDNIPRKIWEWP